MVDYSCKSGYLTRFPMILFPKVLLEGMREKYAYNAKIVIMCRQNQGCCAESRVGFDILKWFLEKL